MKRDDESFSLKLHAKEKNFKAVLHIYVLVPL